jgi:hypothetical protein
MGTLIRETIGGIGTACKLGYSPTFIKEAGAMKRTKTPDNFLVTV